MAQQKHTIVLIPGDGIGPEVMGATKRILEAAGLGVEWVELPAGATAIEQGHDNVLPGRTLAAIRAHKVALKGPVTTPVGKGFKSVNVQLRQALNLYAAVRPVRSVPGVKTKFENVDLVVIRENTEGLYSGIESEVTEGVVTSLKVATEQIATEEYPNIEYETMIVDAGCMRLVQDPGRFDVLLMENLYGDLVSDLCAGLVGGLGVVPGSNIGDESAVFEAVHGSAPDIAGKGVANPLALLMSAVMMLEHIHEDAIAARIRTAYNAVLAEAKTLTRDLGGTANTEAFADAIIEKLRAS